MSDKQNKKNTLTSTIGGKTNNFEPGKSSSAGAINNSNQKKAAVHRKIIADAAKFDYDGAERDNNNSNIIAEDYETSKDNRNRKKAYEDEINMVKDLDRWG
eukprot:gene12631-16937_t